MLQDVSVGPDVPNLIHVITEIPQFSEPVKYEVDKTSGLLFVDRFVGTGMRYPINYGYIPNTLSEDGDPLDVMVLSPHPLLSGSVICVRPIGVLKMSDEEGPDLKILAVPSPRVSRLYEELQDITDCPQFMLEQIAYFFQHYKDLEPGKWVKIDAWGNKNEAHQAILSSIERGQHVARKP